MDKQKQIEEMAEVLNNSCCTIIPEYNCTAGCEKCIAEDLYNAGYHKIPEGAVVLTREEYEELQKGVKTYSFTAMLNAGQEARILQLEERLCHAYEQARKETAEKFAEKLKARLGERKKLCLERWKRYEHEGEGELACYWNGKENEIHCVKADIYEICKEITEGTK